MALWAKFVIESPHHKNWLLALEMSDPSELPRSAYYTYSGQLLNRSKLTDRRRFSLTAHADYTFSETLGESARQINLDASRTKNPRTRELVHNWVRQSNQPSDVVNAALLHFNQKPFAYTLSPPKLTPVSAVDDFVFNTRRGFCEHYASSFVIMMRYAKIPSRVVTGYMGGEFNPMSEHLTVRQSDAHAWAEVWLEGQGWKRIDPTGAVAPERVESGISGALPAGEFLPTFMMGGSSVITNLRQALDALNANWNNWVLGYGKERQWSLLRKLGLERPNISRLIGIMMTVIVVMLLLYVALLNRTGSIKPKDIHQQHYFALLARLEKLGVQTFQHENAKQLAQRASAQLPQYSETIHRFCELYQTERYDPGEQDGAIDELRELLKQIPRQLFAAKPKFSSR